MREPLRDSERLKHIIDAIDNIFEFINGITFDEYLQNKMMRFAVFKNLEIVGEACYLISKELKKQHPEIEWQDVIAMRHLLVHGYYHIRDEIVWSTIRDNIPQFKEQICLIKSKIDSYGKEKP